MPTKKSTKSKIEEITKQFVIDIQQILSEEQISSLPKSNLKSFAKDLLPSIGYSFTTDKITVLHLQIQSTKKAHPGKSGTLQIDYIPPSGNISVTAVATGKGSGSLQLTYLGKNVFATPVDFNFIKGTGFINETPKLP